jgi:serine/threonine protein kinase
MEDGMFQSAKLEKDLLINATSPFFVNLHYSFQSDTKILFLMNFVRGGDLFMHLSFLEIFDEQVTKFFAAQLTLAIGYLHQ